MKLYPSSRKQTGYRALAFSLVEVTMALGIISFGLLSIMGLMPVGLSTLRQAMDQTVEGQIVQKLSGKFLLTPFSQLRTEYAADKGFYFDQEGEEVSVSEASYEVTAKVPINAVYPGSANAPTVGLDSLCVMQIEIKRLLGSQEPNRFNIYVPNSGN